MYRIIPGFMCQGGDFNFGNGGMGESIYGQFMRNERFAFSHSKRGVLSMADAGWEHSNNSNFFITFGPQKHLDGKHVVFGAIEHGMEVLDAIEKVGTIGGKPKRPVIIHKRWAVHWC
ncbi:peptidyl-prolyl cis-trans isomerase CYP18-3, putative [Perkinsus marinus ATCC 50983]|uniref:Peptidyl-prolyl cis-trans isomerase n=1 Tax=Perkinsus marinus (strain ATCC 50983 / TXsc) TaxID=423536 RepID=C5L5U7_PERM5|nr:peptidyl-prolyl cis-trans isomerase CYP18-3, putative [Perkinsus marinus ATCC 50983]EER07896.1 peptidyl-prolyl cis-trans isomerase CYP18-3, putative [Perkinsus marinus ATCC 50983]|eukprot:XP_002776080.1 peptidyl-prolyl cis-trans isomerase CYP18-3, putative [Perkinsus marinus ATCC 50983]